MSDRERFRRGLLDLIARPGAVEIIVALHEHGGSATFAELQAAGVPRPGPLLRSLAAAGQVRQAVGGGTWDAPPTLNTPFTLTAAGKGLAGTLGEIENWGRQHLPMTTGHAKRQRGRTLGEQ